MEPRQENSYDFMRFCAASAVLFSHHFALSRLPEPIVPGYGEDFGKLAVEVFFCLSGFLISRSLQRSTNLAEFVAARFLRIFPNLAFSLLATSLGTLIWYHNYGQIWNHVRFVGDNLLMFSKGVIYTIPGVFEDAKAGPAINGSLWSLPYELWLYVVLFLFFAFGGRRHGVVIIAGAILLSVVWCLTPAVGGDAIGPLRYFQLARLGSFFFAGAVLGCYWLYIERKSTAIGAVAILVIAFLHWLPPDAALLHPLALAAIVVGLGNSGVMAWFSKGGDASYGMYIFAWPLQQCSLLVFDSFWLSMLMAYLATTALGYATWHLFEKRAMSSRKRLAEILYGIVGRQKVPLPNSRL